MCETRIRNYWGRAYLIKTKSFWNTLEVYVWVSEHVSIQYLAYSFIIVARYAHKIVNLLTFWLATMILARYNFKELLDVYTLEEQESCTNALLRNSSQILKKCTVRTPFFAEFQKRLETLICGFSNLSHYNFTFTRNRLTISFKCYSCKHNQPRKSFYVA